MMGAQRSPYNLSAKIEPFCSQFSEINLALSAQILGFVHISLILYLDKIFYFYFHHCADQITNHASLSAGIDLIL